MNPPKWIFAQGNYDHAGECNGHDYNLNDVNKPMDFHKIPLARFLS